jgi:hypothetical protein
MPYAYDPNLQKDDEQQKQQNGVQISGASPTTEASGGLSTPEGQGTQAQQPLKTGSGFQNLDSYLQANQGQQFGNQVTGKVQGEITGAQDNMKKASDQFKTQVDHSGSVASQDQINQAIADPTHADAKQFQSWQNTSYTGPKSLADNQAAWNQYFAQANKAQTSANLLGNEPGRFTLLDQYFGRPSYNFGEKSLDNLLVQHTPGVGEKTQKIQNQAYQLKSQGQQEGKALQDYASKRAGQVEQTRNNANTAFNTALQNQYQTIDSALSAANAQRASQQQQLDQGIASGSFSPDELSALGLTSGTNYYNLDLNNYISKGNPLTSSQVMTPEQRAYVQALTQLGGVGNPYGASGPSDTSPAYSFDNARFDQDLNSVKTQYQNAINNSRVDFSADSQLPGSRSKKENYSYSIPELQKEITAAENAVAGEFEAFGDGAHQNHKWIDAAKKALAQAQAKIDDQYQTGKQLGVRR